jgi:hypothetical protein
MFLKQQQLYRQLANQSGMTPAKCFIQQHTEQQADEFSIVSKEVGEIRIIDAFTVIDVLLENTLHKVFFRHGT